LDSSTCDSIFSIAEDQNLCNVLLNITYNNYNSEGNLIVDTDIYLFDWNITEEEKDTGPNAIMLNDAIPTYVKDELFGSGFEFGPVEESALAIRYIVVGQYSDEPSSLVVIGGVLIND
jgi:hypothetical protein